MSDFSNKICSYTSANSVRALLRAEIASLTAQLNKMTRAAVPRIRRDLAALRGPYRPPVSVSIPNHSSARAATTAMMIPDPIAFGHRLRTLRASIGLSVQQFSDLSNLNYVNVYKWERGLVRPRRAALNTIAEFYGMSVAALVAVRAEQAA